MDTYGFTSRPVVAFTPRARITLNSLVAAFTVVLLALVWGYTISQIRTDLATAEAAALRDAANLARTFAEHSTRTIQASDQTVLFVKSQVEERGLQFDLARYTSNNVILNRFFAGVFVMDENCYLVLSSVQPFERASYADREHVRVHLGADSGQLFVGKPVMGRASKKWSMQLTRRINKPDGSFGGVVVVGVDPHYFSDFYGEVTMPPGSVVSLVGLDGVVRARQIGDDRLVGQDVSSSAVFERAQRGTEGQLRAVSAVDGIERMMAFRRLRDYPLYVTVGIPVEAAKAAVAQAKTTAMVLASAVTVLIAAFAAWILVLVKRMEASRREAIRANRLKSEFLANMSHELRTPLNGILGFAELLHLDVQDGEQRSHVDAISTSGKHLLALVNEFLDLAKIEAGRLELKPEPQRLRGLLEDVVKTHTSTAAQKGIQLALEVDPKVPGMVSVDRMRLTQVLNNLLHNAMKFTDAGRVDVTVDWCAGELRCKVRDTGPGIDRETQSRLFNKFEQGEHAPNRQEGTGLGLALANELTLLMGGRMGVESELGKGSCFHFAVAAPEAPAASPDGSGSPARSGATVEPACNA